MAVVILLLIELHQRLHWLATTIVLVGDCEGGESGTVSARKSSVLMAVLVVAVAMMVVVVSVAVLATLVMIVKSPSMVGM